MSKRKMLQLFLLVLLPIIFVVLVVLIEIVLIYSPKTVKKETEIETEKEVKVPQVEVKVPQVEHVPPSWTSSFRPKTAQEYVQQVYGDRGIRELGVSLLSSGKFQMGECEYTRFSVLEKATNLTRHFIDNLLVPEHPRSWHAKADLFGEKHLVVGWDYQMELIDFFNSWADENGIPYMYTAGNLLGFWDDDFDVFVPMRARKKFLKILRGKSTGIWKRKVNGKKQSVKLLAIEKLFFQIKHVEPRGKTIGIFVCENKKCPKNNENSKADKVCRNYLSDIYAKSKGRKRIPFPNSRSKVEDFHQYNFCGRRISFPIFQNQKLCYRYLYHLYLFDTIFLPIHFDLKYNMREENGYPKISEKHTLTTEEILEKNKLQPYGQWEKFFSEIDYENYGV